MIAARDGAKLARGCMQAVPLYAPDVADCAVDLSDNVNLWGTPPAAIRALAQCSLVVSRYPSLYATPLRDAVLRYLGQRDGTGIDVVSGCGSDDVLDAMMRAYGEPGDEIAFVAPTFPMIPIFARLNGLIPVAVPMTAGYSVDPQRLVDQRAKITYLCSPNNPTSTVLPRESVEYVVEHAAGLVVIDEAYGEFAAETFVDLATRFDRVLVTRTFSKAFGLAGLRVGYGVGFADVVQPILRARGPFRVNALAESAAVAALAGGPDALGWVAEHVALAVANRARLMSELQALGLAPAPAAGNFVFLPVRNAHDVAAAMRRRGVLVRALSGLPRNVPELTDSAGEALRIGVGPWRSLERALAALDAALAEVCACA